MNSNQIVRRGMYVAGESARKAASRRRAAEITAHYNALDAKRAEAQTKENS
jgi:hypothetical protein